MKCNQFVVRTEKQPSLSDRRPKADSNLVTLKAKAKSIVLVGYTY